MLSRSIYEMIPYESDSKPTLTLELYHKVGTTSSLHELHGSVIMHAKLEQLSTVRMGFVFSDEPHLGNFDGFQATTTVDMRTGS